MSHILALSITFLAGVFMGVILTSVLASKNINRDEFDDWDLK